ncbi:GDPP1 phosphorylase, partial [Nyctibius grandis]|nr:GDPP1 phosphorylase [Nyctibius grandis]
RLPQPICSLQQPFDPVAFNFTRIHPSKVLLRLRRAGGGGPSPPDPFLVAINVSPLERGQVLLLLELARGLPQALTAPVLRARLEAALLSARPGFRLGFNSLGDCASVYHLHLHSFYLDWLLPVEAAPTRQFHPPCGLGLLLHGVPAPAFLFYATCPADLDAVARDMWWVAEHLADTGLAYNILITRGDPPEGAGTGAGWELRVLLWAHRPSFSAKVSAAFTVVLCGLAGYLPLPAELLYRDITGAEALRAIRKHLLPEPQLLCLGEDLARLL